MPSDKSTPPRVTRRTAIAMAAAAPWCTSGAAARRDGSSEGNAKIPTDEMLELGARDAVKRIAAGDMTAERYATRLLKQYTDHMDLKPIITVDANRVLDAARAVDVARSRGQRLGPAAGLPFGVKDEIAVAGYPLTGGNGNLAQSVPSKSAPVVDALQCAGGIVFAKTNMPDMVAGFSAAAGVASENPYFGTPRNPYNPDHIVGGTSGGNGVAVAARMIPAAVGEDTNGSIRLPAAACGIVGYRPSTFTIGNALHTIHHKRYSDAGILLDAPGPQDTFGPMARSVADVVFLDTLITGQSSPPIDLVGKTLAIPRGDYWQQDFVDPGVEKVMLDAFARLRDAGTQLVEIDFNAVRAIDDRDLDWAIFGPDETNALEVLEEWLTQNLPGVTIAKINERLADPDQLFTMGVPQMDMPADARRKSLTDAAKRYADLFRSTGASGLVYPTLPIPAPAFDGPREIPGTTIAPRGKPVDKALTFIRNTFWGPALGAPALSIPAGLTTGLPVNLEITGLPGDDRQILGLGLAVEKVLGALPPPPFLGRRA